MVSLFARLFLIRYGSIRYTVCSQHNGMIQNKFFNREILCIRSICKHRECWSKKVWYQNKLKSPLIWTYMGIKMNLPYLGINMNLSFVFSPKSQCFYCLIVKLENHIITKNKVIFKLHCAKLCHLRRLFSTESAARRCSVKKVFLYVSISVLNSWKI